MKCRHTSLSTVKIHVAFIYVWMCSGLDLDGLEVDGEEDKPEREEVDPKENFISHLAASGTFNDSSPVAGGEEGDGEICPG